MPMIVAALMALLVAALVHSVAVFFQLPSLASIAIAIAVGLVCIWSVKRGGASVATALARGLLLTCLVLGIVLILSYTATGTWVPAAAGGLLAAAIGYFAASHFARREPEVPPPVPPAPPPAP